MINEIENKLKKIPFIKGIIDFLDNIKLPGLGGISLLVLLRELVGEIVEGGLSNRAGAIAFNFFMALFPFALFILNLIPFIPIEGFQQDFMNFVYEGVPPNTFDAISKILNDILNNSYQGLLSTGFILSVFLMANGISSVLVDFENHATNEKKRSFFGQYLVALIMSIGVSVILLITVAVIVIFEVFIQKTHLQRLVVEDVSLIITGRYIFLVAMILVTTSVMYKFGTKGFRNRRFISVGSIVTTVLIILTSYIFGIWVVKFSKYNELYGSIGTLLIVMFYIWINCMIFLLGFELNCLISSKKNKKIESDNINNTMLD